jgi:hypothetical protein
MGPHAILAKGYDLAESAALWVHPR